MRYRLAIFDFDGTLADSLAFFLGALDRLAGQHGFAKIAPAELAALRHCDTRQMMRELHVPAWKLPRIARSFMGLMYEHARDIALFEGAGDALRHLAAQGVVLAIVTANSRDNVGRILGPANLGLIRHLECGAPLLGKAARIRRVLRRCAVARHEAIYIGDQRSDAEAARAAGIAFGAVAWGYAPIEALRPLHPAEEFARLSELGRIA